MICIYFMKLVAVRENEKFVCVRYNATWAFSWEMLLKFMNVVYENFTEIHSGSGYYYIAGGDVIPIEDFKYPLHKTKELSEEKGGLSLYGFSKILKVNMCIEVFNQLAIVDAYFLKEDKIAKELLEHHNALDTYFNSIELNMVAADSKKNGIELCLNALVDKNKYISKLVSECNRLGVDMKEGKTLIECPACHTKTEFDETNIPTNQMYEVQCQCGMLMKRKKIQPLFNQVFDNDNNTLILDLIKQKDLIESKIRIYKNKKDLDVNAKKLVQFLVDTNTNLTNTLNKHNVLSYKNEGHEVNFDKQSIIGIIPTNDQSKDGLIHSRYGMGYMKNGCILRKEEVKVYQYKPQPKVLICPKCKNEIEYDDANVAPGMFYEEFCPKCQCSIKLCKSTDQ